MEKNEKEFFSLVKETAENRGSLYTGRVSDRQQLATFMDMNDWFGHRKSVQEAAASALIYPGDVFLSEEICTDLLSHLTLLLDAYHRENAEKLEVLLRYGADLYPETIESYRMFVDHNQLWNEPPAWKLLDYLLANLEKEVCMMKYTDLTSFLLKMEGKVTVRSSSIFTDFCNDVFKDNDQIPYFVFNADKKKRKDLWGAYPFENYALLTACCFSEEYLKAHKVREMACASEVNANQLAYLSAILLGNTIRSTDLERLPRPALPCPGEEFRRRMLAGEIQHPETFSEEMLLLIRQAGKKPHKVEALSFVPLLRFSIPEGLKPWFGTIISIASSFHDDVAPGEPFIRKSNDLDVTRRLFGKAFVDALGNKRFSVRRANKSGLQGLESAADWMAEGEDTAPRGYMLASLARSHKGDVSSFAKATKIYLEDAKFTGYSPEFIAHEMFERGIFGFIPHVLLEVMGGKSYESLSISHQTQLIRQIGISPAGLEMAVRTTDLAFSRAVDTVKETLAGQTQLSDVLQRIATGRAVSRQDDALCLMTACTFTCPFPERAECLGCRYEIYTRALLHSMLTELRRLGDRAKQEEKDGWRYRKISETFMEPMLLEYIATANAKSKEAGKLLLELMHQEVD